MNIIKHLFVGLGILLLVIIVIIFTPSFPIFQKSSQAEAQTTPLRISGTINWVFKSTEIRRSPNSTYTLEKKGSTYASLVFKDGVWRDDNSSTLSGSYKAHSEADSNSGQCIIDINGSARDKYYKDILNFWLSQGFTGDWFYGFDERNRLFPYQLHIRPSTIDVTSSLVATGNAFCGGYQPSYTADIVPPVTINGGVSGSALQGRLLDISTFPTVSFDRHEVFTRPNGAGSDKYELDVTGILSPKPVAKFSFEQRAGGSHFDASGSTPSEGVKSYNWDFGDGEKATSTLPAIDHKYKTGGNYTVSLTITDSSDISSEPASKQISVCTTSDAYPVTLPSVDISYATIKPWGVMYDELPLIFNGTNSNSGSICSLSSTGTLKVTIRLVLAGVDVPVNSVATATLDFLDGSEVPVPVCDWANINHDCSLNAGGPGKTLVRWHTEGFAEKVPLLGDLEVYNSGPLTYYTYVSSTSTIADAVIQAEPYLHTTLTQNLGFIKTWYGIQDPPSDLLVIDSQGNMTGIPNKGLDAVQNIPESLYVKGNDGYSAVILFDPEEKYSVKLTGDPGSSYALSMVQGLPKARINDAIIRESTGTFGSTGQLLTCFGYGCNAAPTVSEISGSESVTESDKGANARIYSVNAADPDNDTLTYSWSVDNNKAQIVGDANKSSVKVDFLDGPAMVNLKVSVDDGNNHIITKTITIKLTNVPPTISTVQVGGVSGAACQVNNQISLAFAVNDPATAYDNVTTTINWGDSTSNAFGNGDIVASHNYKPGTYTAVITAQDKDNGKDAYQQTIAKLYSISALLPPFKGDGTGVWNSGATIPVKVKITDCQSNSVADLAPRISTNLINANTVTSSINVDSVPNSSDSTGMLRYDAGAGQYIYNFSTATLTDQSASYEMVVKGTDKNGNTVTNPSSVKEKFGLRAK